MIVSARIIHIRTGGLQPLGTEEVISGIHKMPVKQAWLGINGLEGDLQADRLHHGGAEKALHHYSASHYAYWQQILGKLPDFGNSAAFGENLTTDEMRVALRDDRSEHCSPRGERAGASGSAPR